MFPSLGFCLWSQPASSMARPAPARATADLAVRQSPRGARSCKALFAADSLQFVPIRSHLIWHAPQMGKLGMHNALPLWQKQYGSIYRCFFGRFAIVVISDPELVKEVPLSLSLSLWGMDQQMARLPAVSRMLCHMVCRYVLVICIMLQVCIKKFMSFHDRQVRSTLPFCNGVMWSK